MQEPGTFSVRILIFSFLVLLINLWTAHHFGPELINILMANGPLAFIALVKLFMPLGSEEEQQALKGRVLSWLRVFLHPRALSLLFIVALLVGSTVSSVLVISSDRADSKSVRLLREGRQDSATSSEKTLSNDNEMVRFIRFTTPFGSPFSLDVSGYQPYSFDLFPLVGKKIRVDKEMTPTPSILIRIPLPVQMLLPNGKIIVKSGDQELAVVPTDEKHGSVLVGRNLSIPFTFIDKWKLELSIDAEQSRIATNRSLLAWQNPHMVKPAGQIVPGRTLEILFIVNDKIKAKAKPEITNEKIQDILLATE